MKLSKQIRQGKFWMEHYGGLFRATYIVIWTTQRNKPVLKRAIAKRLKELIERDLDDFWLVLKKLQIKPAQVEMTFTSINPYLSVAQIVSSIKRDSSGILMKEFHQELREKGKLPRLWNMAYLAVPINDFCKTMGTHFIEAQEER
jgi:REP element-mobilizing transposase RayT